ncbi:hypothetical protein [Pantoea sp.]|uniref:hypothetical protein n=1 Tax=Pantoea sp. TaxID=69393 RepID=UPI0028AE6299|nr:hypothetical protein [Pantoea sp.]
MENSKLSDVKGKELVAAGHAFAKEIGMDTPLIEIAKMVSVLATRLDCALVRGDTLAAENVALRNAHPQPFGPIMMQALDAYEKDREQEPETGMLNAFFILRDSINIKTPATDAYFNSVRAEGVAMFAKHWESNCAHDDTFVGKKAEHFAARLRAGKESM